MSLIQSDWSIWSITNQIRLDWKIHIWLDLELNPNPTWTKSDRFDADQSKSDPTPSPNLSNSWSGFIYLFFVAKFDFFFPSGVLGVLFLQFLRIMRSLLILRFFIFFNPLCFNVYVHTTWLAMVPNYLILKVFLFHLSWREVPSFRQRVILVHIAGMWYVSFQGEYVSDANTFLIRSNSKFIVSYNIFKWHSFISGICTENQFLFNGVIQESSRIKMVFKGHSDYLHCIVARNSTNQVKPFPFLKNDPPTSV